MASERTQHWAVTVARNGENLVTIESNCLSGKAAFTAEDERVIRMAAHNLLGFIGRDHAAQPAPSDLDMALAKHNVLRPALDADVVTLGARQVRISRRPDRTICRDHRRRIAIRNVATNRLSYIPEWRLKKALPANDPTPATTPGTCSTCRWWARLNTHAYGACEHEAVRIQCDATFWAREDFACRFHEPKPIEEA